MRKILQLLNIMCILVTFVSCGKDTSTLALPQEEWELSFANYKYADEDRERSEELGHIQYRTVHMVWYEDNVYVSGILKDYPEVWIKGRVSNNELRFDNDQFLGLEEDTTSFFNEYKTFFFHSGMADMYYYTEFDYNYVGTNAKSIVSLISSQPLVFKISDDRKTISYDHNQWGHKDPSQNLNGAFWFSDKTGNNADEFIRSWPSGNYPEYDFMVNMCFRKVKSR